MWVYIFDRNSVGGQFVVGFFTSNGNWHGISWFEDEDKAKDEVHYLNGGNLQ